MKKQINPTIKAYCIRSAFYVLLLLAVCLIPFAASGIALSQLRKLHTATSSALPGQANTQAKKQLRRGPAFVEIGTVSEPQLRTPKAPAVVLYDQYR